ncbi:MAG: hypothetical protein E7286_04380 [Lachnospiraceae bacterium]|nr:hypothetical protein [Lachnospiraceae bacterium]
MKGFVLKKVQRTVSVMLMTLFIVSTVPMDVQAAELEMRKENEVKELIMIPLEQREGENETNSSIRTLLFNCFISVYCGSSGMEIAFNTDCVQTASRIGVKDIVIKQKVWYGWKTVATSAGGYLTNVDMFVGEIVFTNAIKGETYRITCTHYADADEYTEVHNELDIVFTY